MLRLILFVLLATSVVGIQLAAPRPAEAGVIGSGPLTEENQSWFGMSGSVGWAFPTGNVDGLAGLVEFESRPASDLYNSGFAWSGTIGGNLGNWLVEISAEGRRVDLSEEGRALLAGTGVSGDNIDFISGGLFTARSMIVGSTSRVYLGVGNEVTGMGYSAADGSGVPGEAVEDVGYTLSVKAGMIWHAWGLRPQVRYEIVRVGVDLPNDLTFTLGFVLPYFKEFGP